MSGDRRSSLKQYLEFLESLVAVALILAGLGGLSFNLVRDDGWIETIVGNIWDLNVQYPLIAIPLTIGAIVLGLMWRENRIVKGHHNRLPTFVICALMATGAYYIWSFITRGSL
jgi:hypothetical protein